MIIFISSVVHFKKIKHVTGFGNRQTSYTVRLFLKRCFAVKRLYAVWFMKIWLGIGRLRKSGGQKIDLISLLLNKFS